MATLPVKWYDWRFHGLPSLCGVPGSFTTILDAVLVTGFGDTNVVTINVENKKATFILQEGVIFFKKSVVKITGFTNQALDGEYQVKNSDTGKIEITLDVPDGPLENTNTNIVVKYAPLGWYKPFSSVSRGIYKPTAADALEWMFYMDDTTATYARVRLIENATSIDNHEGIRPYNNLLIWGKAHGPNTTKRPWSIIGDPYCFYYKTSSLAIADEIRDSYIEYGALLFVGEHVRLSNKPDPFAVSISGSNLVNVNGIPVTLYQYPGDIFIKTDLNNCHLFLRDTSGIKNDTDVNIFNRAFTNNSPWLDYNYNIFYTYDNVVHLFTDNFFYSKDRRVTKVPGLVTTSSYRLNNTFDFFIEAKDNGLNRDLIFMRSSYDYNSATNPNRGYFFDITGPWR